MPLVTREYVVKRPGIQAPRHVIERLARFAPTVRLVWNVARDCFQLIEILDNQQWMHVRLLRDHTTGEALPPTLENTVYWLLEHDVRRFHNQAAFDAWLDSLDEPDPEEVRKNEEAAAAKIEEGSDRLWRAFGNRKVVQVKPGDA